MTNHCQLCLVWQIVFLLSDYEILQNLDKGIKSAKFVRSVLINKII